MTELYQGFVTTASALSAVVLNALWQDALIVLCVWLVLRAWPRVNASTRYIVWSATLVAALIVPVATTMAFFTPPRAVPIAEPAAPSRGANPAPATSLHKVSTPRVMPKAQAVPVPPPGLPERMHVTLPLPVTVAVCALWLVLAVYALVRLT